MTIQSHFKFGGQRIVVRIIDTNVLFLDMQSNMLAPLEGLKLNYTGVVKEHPDLKDNPEWKQIAIQRFTDKIKELQSEMDRMKYMINELNQMGYEYLMTQREGFRPQKLK